MLKRTLTFAAAMAALLCLPAMAQQGPPGGGMRRMGVPTVEDLTAKLNLNADQQAKVKAMLGQYDHRHQGRPGRPDEEHAGRAGRHRGS